LHIHATTVTDFSRRILTAIVVSSSFAWAPVALASQLLAPGVGAPDAGLQGATVATPLTPAAAAFSNPAGIMALPSGSMSIGLGVPVGHSHLRTSIPPGYDTTSDFVATAPEAGAIFETDSGLRYGFALYGSLGAVFDSDADPSVGVEHDFFSSSGISDLSLMAAKTVGKRLSIGAALAGIYGQSHLRYFQSIPFAFTVRGGGLQGIVGLRYALTDAVAVGLSFRTPGMLWARGDDGAAGGTNQDVELDLDLPAQVFAGINADLGAKWHVGLVARWTDASTFSGSIFRFEDTPQANVPFIRSASDEWRIAAGAQYAVNDWLTLRGGVGWADAIVPDSWVSPLLIDSAEWKVSGGLSFHVRGWSIDATVGHSPTGVRHVSDDEAAIFPGRYEMGGQIYMLGLRTTL
jgi:long-subunit fatty acid transport protein